MVFIKVVHDFLRKLARLIRIHPILFDEMVLNFLEFDVAVPGTLTAVALVNLVELDTQLHFLLLVKLLLSLELRL